MPSSRFFLASALTLVFTACSGRELREIPLQELGGHLQTDASWVRSARGLELDIGQAGAFVTLPLRGARDLEISVASDSIFAVTYAALAGPNGQLYGPPWRYRVLRPGETVLHLDLLETPSWSPASVPVLRLDGAGHVTIERVRFSRVPGDADAAAAAYDSAQFWAPESIGHTTINLLTPPLWSASHGTHFPDVLAALSLCVGLVALLWVKRARGRWATGVPLAAAALAAAAVADAHFLVRFLPVASVSPKLDAQARLRDNYYFDPEFGALAALARDKLDPGTRVGVIAAPSDWFSAQTLCFNLAPRRCVRIQDGDDEQHGISGVTRLRNDEIDAIVSFVGDATLPRGFTPIARLTPRAVIARRP